MLFMEDYTDKTPEEMERILQKKVLQAKMQAMVVTMGSQGAVYADQKEKHCFCPAKKVMVRDTTGAGDAFCAGVSVGLTCGKTVEQALEIGTVLAASVITSTDNVCPRFQKEEFEL